MSPEIRTIVSWNHGIHNCFVLNLGQITGYTVYRKIEQARVAIRGGQYV